MSSTISTLSFASALCTLLVIYVAYTLVKSPKSRFANVFKIILAGHIPSAITFFLGSLSYFKINIFYESALYYTLIDIGQILSGGSVCIAVYMMKKTLFDKIAQFKKGGMEHGT